MVRVIPRVIAVAAVVAAFAGCSKRADEQKPPAPASIAAPVVSAPAPALSTVATGASGPAVPETQAGTEPGSFALGIVQSADPQEPLHIEPIAHFTGTEWIHAWPNSADAGTPFPSLQDVPTGWLGRPVPRTWAVWLKDGAPINVMVMNTFRQKDGCSVPLVLDVNKRGSDLGLKEVNGLALSTTQTVTGIHAVDPSDGERKDVLAAATAALIEGRRKAIDDGGMRDEERDALSDAKLAHVPITLDYLYRPATGARDIYYFQADQWTKPQDMEAPHIQAWGWLKRDAAGRFHAMAMHTRAGAGSEEGMMGQERELPLGIIEVRGRTFWIFGVSGLESNAYSIYEITPAEIKPALKDVGGGGC